MLIKAIGNIKELIKSELAMLNEDLKDTCFDMWQGSTGLLSRVLEHALNIGVGTVVEHSIQTAMEKKKYDKLGDVFLEQIKRTTKTFTPESKKKLFLSEENEAEMEGLKNYIKSFIDEPTKNTVGLNYLFIGVPGTGKTYSMKVIWNFLNKHAGSSKCECFFFPGSFFKKYSESDAINAISVMFESINKTVDEGKIVALFVDEIDALLASDQDSRSDLLTHFLSNISNLIEKSHAKGKFIAIGSSNHPQVIDEANARRFKMIRFEIPSQNKKVEMFKQYISEYISDFNKGSNRIKLQSNISEKFIKLLMAIEESFTGSDIENIIRQTISFRAYSPIEKLSGAQDPDPSISYVTKSTKIKRMKIDQKKKADLLQKHRVILIREEDILRQCFNVVYTKYEISFKMPKDIRQSFEKKSKKIIDKFTKEKDLDALIEEITELKKYMIRVYRI